MHRPYPKATRQAAIRGRRLDRDREEEKESRVGIRTDFAGQFSTGFQDSSCNLWRGMQDFEMVYMRRLHPKPDQGSPSLA